MTSRRVNEAIIHFEKVLSINPDEISSLMNLSTCYRQKGQIIKAAALLEKALSVAQSGGDENHVHEIEEMLGNLNRTQESH